MEHEYKHGIEVAGEHVMYLVVIAIIHQAEIFVFLVHNIVQYQMGHDIKHGPAHLGGHVMLQAVIVDIQ